VADEVGREHDVGLLDHLVAVELARVVVQQQGEPIDRRRVEVPALALEEVLVLQDDAELLVPGHVHELCGPPPALDLDVAEAGVADEPRMRLGLGAAQPVDDAHRASISTRVVHPAREVQAAIARVELEHGARALGVGGRRHEDPLGEALAPPRIVGGLLGRVGDELGGDRDSHGPVERDDLVVNRGQVAVVERREPPRAHEDAGPAGRPPLDLALEHAGLHIEHTLVAQDLRGGEVERLVVDLQADDRAVRRVDDGLAGAGEAVGVLEVDDRPRLV